MTENLDLSFKQAPQEIRVKVIPNAKITQVKDLDSIIKVYVNAPAVDGKANKAVIESLAKHFKVKKKHVELIKGIKSKEKVFKILF